MDKWRGDGEANEDKQMDRQTDETDFIRGCLTNTERPIKHKTCYSI